MPSIIPLIPITLDMRRHLRFDTLSVMTAERELTQFWGRACTFFEVVQQLLDFAMTAQVAKLSVANLSILLWQGCRHEDPALTLAQVHEAMPHVGDVVALSQLVGAILEAWQAGSPSSEPTQEVESAANPLDGSIGHASGPLLASISS